MQHRRVDGPLLARHEEQHSVQGRVAAEHGASEANGCGQGVAGYRGEDGQGVWRPVAPHCQLLAQRLWSRKRNDYAGVCYRVGDGVSADPASVE